MDIRIRLPEWLTGFAPAGLVLDTDEARMALAVDLARESVRRGGGPFAALVFGRATGELLARGANLVLASGLSVAHAEIVALSAAQTILGSHTLAARPGGCELVSTSEPCAMCLGAILWSGASRVVYGAPGQAARAAGFDEGPVFSASWDYLIRAGVETRGGVLADEAARVFEDYRAAGGVVYNPGR